MTKNIVGLRVDKAYRIEDQLALSIVYQLLNEEGLFLGLSSGINIAGALRYAQEVGPGKPLSPFSATRGTTISQSSLTTSGYVPMVWIRDFRWNHGLANLL